MGVPGQPKIYHITHVTNLHDICQGGLLSDARMQAQSGPTTAIGMSQIKSRRLCSIEVDGQNRFVGEYVPFYFCPRSIMLYMMHMRNHPELSYKGGQEPIVHLEADLHQVVAWANGNGVPWAFSLGNAGSYAVEFRDDLSRLCEIDWPAVQTNYWSQVKDAKAAEFLVYDCLPFHLVERVGVFDDTVQGQAARVITQCGLRTPVQVVKSWYY